MLSLQPNTEVPSRSWNNYAASGDVLSFEDVEVHIASFRVFRGGQEIRLGPLEFRLLCHLIGAPRKVVSRAELAQAVWQQDICVGSRTVDVHVARLRRALNSHGERKLIRTVRGAGYALR